MTLIHVCAHGLPLCLPLPFQLRAAGAAVIQELFPRVSSIATLDISDNGTVAHRNTSFYDLHFLSLGSLGLSGLLMNRVMCVLTGLDADLLTVLPALSRHPSLKHLHLGKNFNIKNRCIFCHALLRLFVCACEHKRTCAACASLNIRVWDFTSIFISGCRSSGRQLASSRKLLMPAHPTSSVCSPPWFVSAGFWTRSCRSWFNSYRRRNV